MILSCSDRKHPFAYAATAWQLYDGVAYRMLKKLQREREFPADVDIAIISAKHGLIEPERAIRKYNVKMDMDRAFRQLPVNTKRLAAFLARTDYREIYLHCGVVYKAAVPLERGSALGRSRSVVLSEGRIGVQLRMLKQWLSHGRSG